MALTLKPPLKPLSLDDLLRALLARSYRAVLHRLRGIRALLGGWVEVGVPPGSEHRVRARLDEDMALLQRLDWIGSMLIHTPPLQRMEAGEAPQVLLAVALGMSSPEEARTRLPVIHDPRAAVGAALWLQACATECVLDYDVHLRWEGRSLRIELVRPHAADLPEWEASYGDLLLRREPAALVFRPGLFAPAQAEDGATDAH